MDWNEILQSAPFGVLTAAAFTAISTWLLWWITRGRDDRLEARRSRIAASVETLRAAHQVRSTSVDLAAFAVGMPGSSEKDDPERRLELENLWIASRDAAIEQLVLSQALAARDVAEALSSMCLEDEHWMVDRLNGKPFKLKEAEAHKEALDAGLLRLAEAVRKDARTDLGA